MAITPDPKARIDPRRYGCKIQPRLLPADYLHYKLFRPYMQEPPYGGLAVMVYTTPGGWPANPLLPACCVAADGAFLARANCLAARFPEQPAVCKYAFLTGCAII